jgi:uncharacterized membrane protein YvbJ
MIIARRLRALKQNWEIGAMALTRCQNCGSQISTEAENCLKCGALIPPRKRSKRRRARFIAPAFGSRTQIGIGIASLAIIFLFLVLMFGRG